MQSRYKVAIYNKKIFKEAELFSESNIVKIGTTLNCDVRLRKELFFEPFELVISFVNQNWQITCSDNIYLKAGDVRKLRVIQLKHGDLLEIKYQSSDYELFKLSFTYDFYFERKDYDYEIDVSNINSITIGGVDGFDINTGDTYLNRDYIIFEKNGSNYYINDNNIHYGVYINGTRMNHRSIITDYDFFSVANTSFYFKNNKLYTTKRAKTNTPYLPGHLLETSSTCFEFPKFNRSTRMQYMIPNEDITIQQPEPKPQKPRKNIMLTLIPALASLGLMVVLRGFMGNGGTFIIYSVSTMTIGIIMSVVSYMIDGRTYKKDIKKREELYNGYIDKKRSEIESSRSNELRVLELIYTSLMKSIHEVRYFGKRIFERHPEDMDYLNVYLGTGAVAANCKVNFNKQEFIDLEDPISLLPEQLEGEYRLINNAPIVSDFRNSCGIGVAGDRNLLQNILKNMTLDIAIRHFYKNVKLFYIFNEQDLEDFQWIRWLRNVQNEDLDIRNIVCDDESANIILESLYSELVKREELQKASENSGFETNYVVFSMSSDLISKHPISKYIYKSSDYGFTFVFLEEHEELLPAGCKEIIRVSSDKEGILVHSKDSDVLAGFNYQNVNNTQAEEVTLKLGSIDIEEVSLEKELPKNITMYELLKILSIDDLSLKDRWSKSEVYKSMAAPIGVRTKNDIVYLDISDKASAHGPHGLVAGTTGSGKSEILQTYILSMAALFHPYDVGFVLIDFKGGGMANQFKDLPHLIGTITNIDGRELDRSLLSIKAEIIKRQKMFSQSGVNHINDYIKLFKQGKVTEPLPHLIMVVDEFAELKAEYPDFMKEIISASRIGRTLGVHLILATQKPAGVVDSQIWSNSKFKLCLKVQTKEDSNEVIKTPLAAEIKEPGRAYLQVGNNEIFELFQSAYSGAKVSGDGAANQKTYDIYSLNPWGKKSLIYTNRKKESSDNDRNQLQIIVSFIKEYCEKNGIKALDGICLPPLSDIIYSNKLKNYNKKLEDGIAVPIGIYDDPEQQKQDDYVLNLSENNTYIIGASQTGKTTLLQTILLQIMQLYTPSEVNLYIIDCGNMALKIFEAAKHVGGVALISDEEKVQNLFKMLAVTIQTRKNIFAGNGIGTYAAYLEAGLKDMPQILLMIDNIVAFREHFAKHEDELLALSREGQSVGINLVVTGAQANSIGFKALTNYGNRIALNCNDKGEYSNLFDRNRLEPKNVQGRGICSIDKRILEFQTVLTFEGDKEIIRVEKMKAFIHQNALLYDNEKARRIPEVPEVIARTELLQIQKELYGVPYQIPFGIDYTTMDYRTLDLLTVGMLAIAGRDRSGKTNFVFNLLNTIKRNIFTNLTEAYIIDDDVMQLEEAGKLGFVKEYTTNAASIGFFIDTIYEELENRQTLITANRGIAVEEVLKDKPLLLLIIENIGVIDELTKDKKIQTKMNTILKQYKKLKIAILFSHIENSPIAFNSAEMLKLLKENKKLLVFDDIENVKVFDVTPKQIKEFTKPIRLGDAYMNYNGELSKVKTLLDN